MRSSFIAFIFCVTIALLALVYGSNMLLLSKSIEKTSLITSRELSNIEFIQNIPEIVNKEKESGYKKIFEELKKIENSDIEIEIVDLSSKFNPNFMDFTLFKNSELKALLNNDITWRNLQEYRDENGFISNLTIFNEFFKTEEELFTLFNLVNINNCSDTIIADYYEIRTNNNKGENLKNKIVNARISNKIFDEKTYSNMITLFDKDIKNHFTIQPNWNVNFVPDIILHFILSKKYRGKKIPSYNIKYNQIKDLRKTEEITLERLKSILNLGSFNKGVLTYLGDTTTFWQVKVIDKPNKLSTTLVLGLVGEEYKVISILTELL